MSKISLPAVILKLCSVFAKNGASVVIVGGYVRDALLGKASSDIDIEVYGIDGYERVKKIVASFGKTVEVGRTFGVIKLLIEDLEIDIALPRTEIKTAHGHCGFNTISDSSLNFKQAAFRRDFTINAIGYNPLSEELLDPYGGANDLRASTLRHIDEDKFREDPLRVLRAVQFVARFNLTIHPKTLSLCLKIVKGGELKQLAKERIFHEITKLFTKSLNPSIGLMLFEPMGILSFFHPLPSFSDRTYKRIDAIAKSEGVPQRVMLFGSLFWMIEQIHNLDDVVLTLKKLTDERELIKRLCSWWERREFCKNSYSDTEIRVLSTEIRIKDFATVLGSRELLNRAEALGVASIAPKPLLMGRHLKNINLKPSPKFKTILDAAYEAQLAGKIATKKEALAWLKESGKL